MAKKGSKQKRYSAEFKISVIMDMRENHLSYREQSANTGAHKVERKKIIIKAESNCGSVYT